MSLEALLANLKPYDVRLHKLRGFQGAVTSATKAGAPAGTSAGGASPPVSSEGTDMGRMLSRVASTAA